MPRPLQRQRRAHAGRVRRFDATRRRPVDKWTAAPRLTTCPQGKPQQQKRTNDVLPKPAKLTCYPILNARIYLGESTTKFRRLPRSVWRCKLLIPNGTPRDRRFGGQPKTATGRRGRVAGVQTLIAFDAELCRPGPPTRDAAAAPSRCCERAAQARPAAELRRRLATSVGASALPRLTTPVSAHQAANRENKVEKRPRHDPSSRSDMRRHARSWCACWTPPATQNRPNSHCCKRPHIAAAARLDRPRDVVRARAPVDGRAVRKRLGRDHPRPSSRPASRA